MKRKSLSICSLALSAALLAGCSNPNASAPKETTAPTTTAEPKKTEPATTEPVTAGPTEVEPTKTAPTPTDPTTVAPSDPGNLSEVSLNVQYDQFTLELLKRALAEEKNNVMISPLSMMQALSMTANGAAGNTAQEMLSVLGGGMTMEQLNYVLNKYTNSLPSSEDALLSVANSIWYKDTPEFSLREDFRNATQKYYSADIFPSAFDKAAVTQINKWVSDKTDGMISKVLDQMAPNVRMLLINAILFDGKWAEEYYEDAIQKLPFTNADGEKKEVEMMSSSEGVYLSNDKCVGFMKYYKGSRYAFVGLLPKQGTPDQLISEMTAKDLQDLFNDQEKREVHTLIPKFTFDYSKSMNEILISMGMKDAFDDTKADFSNLSNIPLYISDVLHKTRVEVTEKGTRAAAVTVVTMTENCVIPEETPSVYLDRPFVFMIVDTDQYLPIFIGRVNDLEGTPIASKGAIAPDNDTPENDKPISHAKEVDISDELAQICTDPLLLDIFKEKVTPVLVEYGFSGEAGYSLCSTDEEAIIAEFIEAIRELNIEECISKTERVSFYADYGCDIIFHTSDGRKATVSFDGLEYMYIGEATYKVGKSARFANICELMPYVPVLADISEDYIAVLHGGAGERTYETYVYKAGDGYMFYNVTSTTVSWGATEWTHKVNDYGFTDSKEEILRRAKAHGADQCMTYDDDNKAYPIEDFLNSKEG
ncbi:MAG: serpin family protein [Lachnospiraceae bacterium]|nr:serpin family protein [Lachnospiraceae bacterium]